MFHLFDNVYLENEKRFFSKHHHYLLFSEDRMHPAARYMDGDFPKIHSMKEVLKEHFNESEEIFWEKITENPKERKLILFADDEIFFKLKIVYWKSILKNPSPENLYQLYMYDSLDRKLKRYQYVGDGLAKHNEQEIEIPLNKEVFREKVEDILPAKALEKLDKSRVGFELLLANYFFSGRFKDAFLNRLKELSWRAWFDDLEILRSEIINSFYDIKRAFPSTSSIFTDANLMDHVILSEPKLSWILDSKIGERDIEHVRKTYSKEMFMELGETILKFMEGKNNNVEEHILPTKYVFEDRYEELLKNNIAKNFGCLFVNDQLKRKSNQLLPLLVYEKVRENKIPELSFMELN